MLIAKNVRSIIRIQYTSYTHGKILLDYGAQSWDRGVVAGFFEMIVNFPSQSIFSFLNRIPPEFLKMIGAFLPVS